MPFCSYHTVVRKALSRACAFDAQKYCETMVHNNRVLLLCAFKWCDAGCERRLRGIYISDMYDDDTFVLY